MLVSKTGKGANVTSIADLKKLQLCAQSKTTDLDYIKNTIQPDKAPLEYPSTRAGEPGGASPVSATPS